MEKVKKSWVEPKPCCECCCHLDKEGNCLRLLEWKKKHPELNAYIDYDYCFSDNLRHYAWNGSTKCR